MRAPIAAQAPAERDRVVALERPDDLDRRPASAASTSARFVALFEAGARSLPSSARTGGIAR